jgi:Putative Flp pilus-assembly TadE/G-like
MIFVRLKAERGQAFVLTALAMLMCCAMAAFVLDVGHWFRDKRRLQGTADAAALAGAQRLPDDPVGAKAMAQSYADKNGGDVAGANIVVSSTYGANDTIAVKAKRTDPGIFSRVLAVGNTDISARAKARVDIPQSALHVAPMVVHCNHPLIQNCNSNGHLPQFNVETSLDYDPMGAPGAFGMLNLSKGGGTPGSSEEADWILHGYGSYLGVNKNYRSDPGAKFSSNEVQGALESRLTGDPVLLFPVFERLTGTGQNAEYYIIGWIGFHLTKYVMHGNNATLTGYFTTYIAQGILTSGGPSNSPNYGVKSIQLIE